MSTGGYRKRDRSRSPVSANNVGHRRAGNKNKDMMQTNNTGMGNNMPMMMNNLYQGNMTMPGMVASVYPNMMMQGNMMAGGMMPTPDMMANSGMDMMSQQSMDMTSMGSNTPTGSMDMNMMGGVMMDPSLMALGGMGNMGMYPMGGEMQVVEKKEIVLKHCKLTPGNTDPPQRSRPLGCRTIFVGGWPEKIRESIVRDIFERYGRIHTLRLSKKNFCHIRFDRESSVDAAINISGYKIKIFENEKEEEEEQTPANSGWLHVDYALSRDDQNEYERRQRQALRIQQQLAALSAQQEMGPNSADMNVGFGGRRRRSPSPSPVIQPFAQNTIVQLQEKIKNEDNFAAALPTLLTWLERGECSKKNSNQFYSMIQATNSHIRRLYNEKMQSEEELQDARERIKQNIARVIDQLEQVAKVFNAATHQRVWDHFTKPQRKNIESWQRMTQEFNILREEFNEKFNNEEKDNEYNNANAGNDYNYGMPSGNDGDSQALRMENDSLRFQLEAYRNEVEVVKTEAKSELERFKAQFIARQAVQRVFENNPPVPPPLEKPPPPPPLPGDAAAEGKEPVEAGCGEAKLIGVMSAFLQVHPQGASLDYVVSYVRGVVGGASHAAVRRVLLKHPDVFQQTTSGVGADIDHRWNFVAFARPASAAQPAHSDE